MALRLAALSPLIVVAQDMLHAILSVIRVIGILVFLIGGVRQASKYVTIMTKGNLGPLTPAVRDEIALGPNEVRRRFDASCRTVNRMHQASSSGGPPVPA